MEHAHSRVISNVVSYLRQELAIIVQNVSLWFHCSMHCCWLPPMLPVKVASCDKALRLHAIMPNLFCHNAIISIFISLHVLLHFIAHVEEADFHHILGSPMVGKKHPQLESKSSLSGEIESLIICSLLISKRKVKNWLSVVNILHSLEIAVLLLSSTSEP